MIVGTKRGTIVADDDYNVLLFSSFFSSQQHHNNRQERLCERAVLFVDIDDFRKPTKERKGKSVYGCEREKKIQIKGKEIRLGEGRQQQQQQRPTIRNT